jgi:hypothetical protein
MMVIDEAKFELEIVWIARPQPFHRKAKDKHAECCNAVHVGLKKITLQTSIVDES